MKQGKCLLNDVHYQKIICGKLERGELHISINSLNKICLKAGVKADYILYGVSENKHLSIRKTIDNFLDKSSNEDLKMYFKFISMIRSFVNTKTKEEKNI